MATIPVQLFVQDANGAINPVTASGSGLNVNILDRADAEQEFYTGTKAASGDNSVLAAPGSGLQYLIAKLQIHNQSTTATKVIVKFGSREVWTVDLPVVVGAGAVLDFPAPDRMEGRDNQPLLVNLSAANDTSVSVQYYTVAV